jgi:outer membrane protein assembly factor BamB
MCNRAAKVAVLLAAVLLAPLAGSAQILSLTFQPGDVIVSLEPGPVQWWRPNGTLRGILLSTVGGFGEGMAFDRQGNLYVNRWRYEDLGLTGNTVEMFNAYGLSRGKVGSGYNCDPHTIAFDAAGTAYVGQAGCLKTVLKFAPGATQPSAEFAVAEDNQGVFWSDLAPDQCTLFYTSMGPNVKRFDVCAGRQLADFNQAPLPGGVTHDLRLLPDGGVLVASGEVIARLDGTGALVATYRGSDEGTLWAGLDLVGDGTFWAGNYYSSNVYRFNLATGAVVTSFNTGTQPNTVVGVRVKR